MTIVRFQVPLDREQSDEVLAPSRSCREGPSAKHQLTFKCMLKLHERIVMGLATDSADANPDRLEPHMDHHPCVRLIHAKMICMAKP